MQEGCISIGTYNVKRFEIANPRSIVALLAAEHIDVCGLQEVPGKKALDQLLQDTPYQGIFLGPYFTYGIALVYNKTLFDCGLPAPKLHMLKDGQNKKAALEVTLRCRSNNSQLTLFVTHLDHKTEPQRLAELKALLKIPKPQQHPHLLLGDFNALKRSDYTESEWEHIAQVRKASGWESPKVELVETLERVGCYVDLLGTNTELVVPTSRFDTRVDYIFATADVVCQAASVVVSPLNESDHKPIVVRIKI